MVSSLKAVVGDHKNGIFCPLTLIAGWCICKILWPLTPPVLLFAHILYIFFPPPLLLLVRTLSGQFVNANNADRLRSRTAAN